MKVYVLTEYCGGGVGVYSTREKALEALKRDEEKIKKLDGVDFYYEDGDYDITEVEINGEILEKG